MYWVTTISCRPFSVPFAFSLWLCISYFLINYLTVWRTWKTNTLPCLCAGERQRGNPFCLDSAFPLSFSLLSNPHLPAEHYVGEIFTASFNGIISLSLTYPPANPINHILIFASLSLKANHYFVFVIWFLKLYYSVPSSSITGCQSRNRKDWLCNLLPSGCWRVLMKIFKVINGEGFFSIMCDLTWITADRSLMEWLIIAVYGIWRTAESLHEFDRYRNPGDCFARATQWKQSMRSGQAVYYIKRSVTVV